MDLNPDVSFTNELFSSEKSIKIGDIHSMKGSSKSERKRYWTKSFKREVVETILSMNGDQESIGKYLREKGLYMVLFYKWKAQYDRGDFTINKKLIKAGEISTLSDENKKLQIELAKAKETISKLSQKLSHAEVIVDAQKKISELFSLT